MHISKECRDWAVNLPRFGPATVNKANTQLNRILIKAAETIEQLAAENLRLKKEIAEMEQNETEYGLWL